MEDCFQMENPGKLDFFFFFKEPEFRPVETLGQ